MSSASTRTLWKVEVEAGTVYAQRTGEWLFTNERAARSFAATCQKHIEAAVWVEVTEIEAEMFAGHALYDASQYLFPELKEVIR